MINSVAAFRDEPVGRVPPTRPRCAHVILGVLESLLRSDLGASAALAADRAVVNRAQGLGPLGLPSLAQDPPSRPRRKSS